mmetsp:Transcript_29621/g.45388  ORF Transcript_29621/g.45388 Transcript_29621/m.45388 type:complete len:90 (+) Transcript_29621:839-1108(+)
MRPRWSEQRVDLEQQEHSRSTRGPARFKRGLDRFKVLILEKDRFNEITQKKNNHSPGLGRPIETYKRKNKSQQQRLSNPPLPLELLEGR